MLSPAERTAICSACVKSTSPLCSQSPGIPDWKQNAKLQVCLHGLLELLTIEVPVVRHELARSSLFAINSKAKIGHLLLPDSIE